jgi:ligand-binding SRPBCC domain-containing protein
MPIITLETLIKSTIETCFDLSCSIDLHKISTAHTKEKAIAGKTSGLIGLNEQVTWQAKHFGITQKLTTKITAYNRPFYFRDEQIKGAFQFIQHDHYFETQGQMVMMKDKFHFQSPLGYLGTLADKWILTNYLTKLLVKRNQTIKTFAENEQWKWILAIK